MEIDRTSAARPQRLFNQDALPAPAPADADAPAERRDRIELSEAARRAGPASADASSADSSREALLDDLRAQVDAGTYGVDADGVARRIVARVAPEDV